jgi:hypothetical protein
MAHIRKETVVVALSEPNKGILRGYANRFTELSEEK